MTATTLPGRTDSSGRSVPVKERFLVLPIIILILAQMGATGDSGALSLAASALTADLGATTSDIKLANMIYPLVGGAFMIAGGLMGTIIGWKRTFRIGTLLCAAGEVVLALAPNMTVFIWVGRVLVGFGASFMIPSVLGLIPLLYRGPNRTVAFGCIGAASGLSAVLPLVLGVVMEAAGMHVTFLALAAYFVMVFAVSFSLPPIEEAGEKLRFDGVGVALAATGLFLFLIGISSVSSWGLVKPLAGAPFTFLGISPALPLAALGLVLLAVLVRVERGVEFKNVVALALPERDAAQSGGIQSTMRNVGQALGVAFLGAVLSGAAAPRRLRLVRWAQRPMSSIPAAWGAAWAPTAIPRRYRASRYRVDIPGARCCRPCAW